MENDGSYFSPDPVRNPTMHDWSVAYLKYCDGASFSGRSVTPGDSDSGPPQHPQPRKLRIALSQGACFSQGRVPRFRRQPGNPLRFDRMEGGRHRVPDTRGAKIMWTVLTGARSDPFSSSYGV